MHSKFKIFEAYLKENNIPKNHSLELNEDDVMTFGDEEWLILTDSEANARTKEEIENSLWAFNYEFIYDYFQNNHLAYISAKTYKDVQSITCESFNDIVIMLVGKNLKNLVASAIESDGRGNYLSSYDGKEHCFHYKNKNYYLYRI